MEVNPIIDRYNRLKSVRDGCWLNVWREVRRYVMPTYSDYLTEGGARGENIFDTTAGEARSRLSAGMYAWMFDPQKRNFELGPQDEELAKDEDVKDYFSAVTKAVSVALANSNWPSVLIESLENLACGLDAVVYCEDGGADALLNFKSFPIETVCYQEDWKGAVDTVFRELKMTSRQMVQKFAEKDLPEKIRREAADTKTQDTQHTLLHAVFPRPRRDPNLYDNKNFPFADVYIELESKQVVYESGFEEFPFAVCRFSKSDNETYGRGPGLNKLPDIKMLNRMRQAYILACEKQADPTVLVPDGSLVSKNFDRDPGGVVTYKATAGAKPEFLYNTANLQRLYADIESERDKIKIGFFWDIFDPLGDLKQITATEAEIRNDGKMIPFAPVASNLHTELYQVVINRVFGICSRGGMLPEPPAILRSNPGYKVEFVSKIALSIKKLESLGWLQTEASISNIAAVKPDVMDNFELDDVARDISISNGSSPKWLVPVKKRDAVRQQRQQQQAQQAQAQALLESAKMAGGLAKAPEPGSPLSMVMNGQGV